MRDDYRVEMENIAEQIETPVDTPTGPLHARNLDWWAENDTLRRYTITTRFTGAPAGEFTTVGGPGLPVCFSELRQDDSP